MTNVTLEIGQSLDETWAERARALPPAKRDQLMSRADAMREQTDGGPTAYACYRALRDDLDPTRPADAERLTWLLRRARGPDRDLEELSRMAAASVPGTGLWYFGQYRLAHYEQAAGRIDDAVKRLFALRKSVAGGDPVEEGGALANLALCLLQQRRTLESLLTGRRAVAALERAGHTRALLHTRIVLARLYMHLHDWSRHEAEMAAVEAGLPALSEEDREFLAPQHLMMSACGALERRRLDEAVALFERFERVRPEKWSPSAVRRAHALTLLGRVDEATRVVAQLRTRRQNQWLTMRIDTVDTMCTVARDAKETVSARVERFFESLPKEAPSRRAQRLVDVAEALRARGGFDDLAKRAYDLAAASILARMAELDRFAREEQPQLEITREERLELGRIREALLERHEEVRHAVIRHVHAMPDDWFTEDGLFALCAWCGCVRHRDGTWIPLGALLPEDPRLRVTHGMCPDCGCDQDGAR